MKTIIKIEKEDINTSILGYNVQVQISTSTSLVFTQEALDELVSDYKEIKAELEQYSSSIVEGIKKLKPTNQIEIPFDEAGI